MGQNTSQPVFIPNVVTLSLVVKKTTCADALQPSVTRVTRSNITYRTSGRFLELPNIAIRATFSPIENYRTSRRFFESTDFWVRSLTWYSQSCRTSGRFSGTGRHLSLVTYPELENLSNIREVSRKCQHLSCRIFLKLVNLPNIREVLALVLLSQVPHCVLILPIVLLNFVDRHATKRVGCWGVMASFHRPDADMAEIGYKQFCIHFLVLISLQKILNYRNQGFRPQAIRNSTAKKHGITHVD